MELLPAEIIYNICAYMNTPAIISLSVICKQVYYNMPSFKQLHREKFINVIKEINQMKYSIDDTPPGDSVSSREINGKKYKMTLTNIDIRGYRYIETAETIYVADDDGLYTYMIRSIRIVKYGHKISVRLITEYDIYGVNLDYEIAGADE